MVDDKNDQTPDPWAGIDAEAESTPADGFSFSFDSAGEAAAGQETPPTIGMDGEADRVAADSMDEWLSEPAGDAANAPPLAVFPPDGPVAGDFGLDAQEPEATANPFAGIDADDIHGHEQPAGQAAGGSMIQSSAIQIGTGHSGIESESGVVSIDEWADAAAGSAVDPAEIAAESEPGLADFGVGAAAADAAEYPFESDSFDGDSQGDQPHELGLETAAGGLIAVGAAAAASAAEAPAKKKKTSKPVARQKGAGIGQMVGVVLGGLMSLPITYAILVWGFQKDPFKFTKMVPPEVAFLLPEKFQPGFKKPTAGPDLDKAASLDTLPPADAAAQGNPPVPVTVETPAEETVAANAPPAAESPADDAVAAAPKEEPLPPADDAAVAGKPDLFTEPAPREPAAPQPEPLDLSALEAAISKAEGSFDELASVDAADPGRKKMLVGWYKNLALVAEEMVMLEKTAADTGRPLEKQPEQVEGIYGRIAGDESAVADLAKLSGMWLSSKKRPADGAVLLATLESVRQVGPYWSALIRLDGAEPRTVSLVSSREPAASAGERVLVTGVLFDGDVVWAADCRRLEKRAAPVEDLF